tara:strand:+ start:740 stop:973 length:234 start_codon:yes stop_codon:yes gene_type:complete
MKKLTKKELENLQEKVTQLNNALNNLGRIEMQKQQMIIETANFEKQVKYITDEFEDKYGKMQVNIETGEMKEIEDNE